MRPQTLIRVITLAAILGCAALSVLVEWSARRNVDFGRRYASSPDSAVRASAAYHGAQGQLVLDERWSLRGHGTLGVAGILAGGAALAAALRLQGARKS
jgi:hypothetical protein